MLVQGPPTPFERNVKMAKSGCNTCGRPFTTATEKESMNLQIDQFWAMADAAIEKSKQLQAENKRLREALRKISHEPCMAYDGCDDKKCTCPRGMAQQALQEEKPT